MDSVMGVPRWVLLGVLSPWVVFFGLHLWFCRERKHDGHLSRR